MQERKLSEASLKKEGITYNNEYTQKDMLSDKIEVASSGLFSLVIFL